MKTKNYYRILAGLLFLTLPLISHAQTRYFEQEEVIKVPNIKVDTQLYMLNYTQKSIVRTFRDGLGRPVQTSAIQASPTQKDIVSFQHYNKLGQPDTAYLPYVAGDGSGGFHNNAATEQKNFYSNGFADKVADDSMPFSRQIIENSPLQRLLQAGSVGSGFQPGEHYSAVNYRFNNSAADGNIILWLSDGTRSGSYADNSLSVTEATGPDGNKALSFTDKAGRTVLKRQKLNATNIDTYYIYNNAGAISYAIPPKAVKLLTDNVTFTLTQASVAPLLYKYTYDVKGRLSAKTISGSGDLYVIYDPLDRPVLLQDANLRATNRWNFIKYDLKGRAVVQGYYADATNTTPAAMQTYVDGMASAYNTLWYEGRSSSSGTGYYTTNVFPTTGTTILACSIYDDYDLNYDASHVADFSYTAQGLTGEATATTNTRGMLTISRTRSVGSGLANVWLNKVIFYDKRGNVIQVRSNNQLVSTLNDMATSVPDFTGLTLQTKVVKTHGTGLTTTVLSTYKYDHMNRVKAVMQRYNAETGDRTIATYDYNELGQLMDKKLGISAANPLNSLQSVDYRYNIRGQLLSINNSKLQADAITYTNDDTNDVFGEELSYNISNTQVGSTGTWAGQLTAVKWMSLNGSNVKSNERSYKYTYDGLGRFTQALYAERLSTAAAGTSFGLNTNGFTEKVTGYDENGNIQGLQRYSSTVGGSAGTKVDGLKYTYDTNNLNKLLTVGDTTANNGGFRNYTGTTTGSYTYDAAGNLTADPFKGISQILYNVLNRVDKVTLTYPSATGRYIDYTYDASGKLLRKRQYDNSALVKTTDYIDGFIYTTAGAGAAQLDYFAMPEGRVRNTGGATITLKQEFVITDHQGNARISFEDNGSGAALVVQENSYYAFGMSMTSTMGLPTAPNKNLYNGGSEWQNDFADQPDWQQTFYRNYDAALGRFLAVDPMAEASESMTVYQYGNNNPVMMNDPMGDLSSWSEVQDVINKISAREYGGEWHKDNPNMVFTYADDLTGFYMGAAFMAANNSYGLNSGWAQNYNVAAANYNISSNRTGANAQYSNGSNIVIGKYYHTANGDATTINGVSGEFQSIATQPLKTRPANQGGDGAWDWVKNHFYEEGSYEISRGSQLAIGIKKGLDVTLNAGSTVMYSGKVTNRNLKFEMDNSKRFTHEIGAAWIVGGGVKYTHDNVKAGEVELSAGALGFLGGSVTLDTNGNVTNWFGGINIDAHIAVYFGIQGTYKLGFAK